jgi:sialate O-acetylesterase
MKRIIFLLALFLFIQNIQGKVKLPNIFSNDMVLQQNTTVKIWGWANPNEKITVKAGWAKSPVSVVTGADGKWLAKIKTIKAGGPYSITISGEDEITLTNVLLGEVWICSGQSNMEYTIKMLGGWELYKNEKEDFVKNDYSKMRFCQIEKATSDTPMDTCKARWFVPTLENTETFSATAYFYGRELFNKLNVPIGLISTNWGGTPAEAWTEIEYLKKDDDLNYYIALQNKGADKPASLYNAMINPLINYTIKGAIWYQGEANVDNSNLYNKLFTTMIKCWREKWQIGNFPFYFVQIAPYNYGDKEEASAYLREAQTATLKTAKNSGMAVTMDIGNISNIHPKNKQEVGRRLALWAFAKTYKQKTPVYSGPLYKNFKIEKNKIRLFFDYADKGLIAKGEKLTGFKIADNSMNFTDAEAEIQKNSVVVYNKDIANPVAVRFAFTNTDTSNLFNKDMLPATSFRTDKLPFYKPQMEITPFVKIGQGVADFGIFCADSKAEIHYTTDGTEPSAASPKYEKTFTLDKSSHVKARAYKNGTASLNTLESVFEKHAAFGKDVVYKNAYSEKYASSKEFALTDGLRGSGSFNDGRWQGFPQVNLDAVIDLGEVKAINQIGIGFLKAIGSSIFPPKKIEYFVSDDGINFVKKSEIINTIPASYGNTEPETFTTTLQNTKARYIKIVAENQNVVPDWHQNKGGKAWLFADEIIVN